MFVMLADDHFKSSVQHQEKPESRFTGRASVMFSGRTKDNSPAQDST
jgi:hypothetical protein